MKKALITGISGFVGSHLTELLLSLDFQVFGVAHPDHGTTHIDNFKKDIV
ncbi:MAG: GDP-mannose 4,6-dehydratase, partial [Candidatus Magasanikbacteria bacterium]|nr:GDP-mannose 4,6-dehydratase [Candidatus Magasanikbacteria bacterium]